MLNKHLKSTHSQNKIYLITILVKINYVFVYSYKKRIQEPKHYMHFYDLKKKSRIYGYVSIYFHL